MILYFSGTGNSEYVANRIGKAINDEVINLFDKIKNHDYLEMNSKRPWIIVVPTYAWRIPRIVQDWIMKTNFTGSNDIYFVMTCGDNIGNAYSYLKKLCNDKKLHYMGCKEIVMPENYIAMFTAPAKEEALQIINKAEIVIDEAIKCIKNHEVISQPSVSIADKISSGIVNDIFYPVFVHDKKFYATDACIACGQCVNVCPLSNIVMKNNKPVWNNHCTHCMACICKCPVKAIEYGKKSKGKERYTFPKVSI